LYGIQDHRFQPLSHPSKISILCQVEILDPEAVEDDRRIFQYLKETNARKLRSRCRPHAPELFEKRQKKKSP